MLQTTARGSSTALLSIFADQITFLKERDYRNFSVIKIGREVRFIDNIHDSLALLVKRYNDRATRVIMRPGCHGNPYGLDIICVDFSRNGGIMRYDFALENKITKELLNRGYVIGALWERCNTYSSELHIEERGVTELLNHIKRLKYR